jgi:hypothetical protein
MVNIVILFQNYTSYMCPIYVSTLCTICTMNITFVVLLIQKLECPQWKGIRFGNFLNICSRSAWKIWHLAFVNPKACWGCFWEKINIFRLWFGIREDTRNRSAKTDVFLSTWFSESVLSELRLRAALLKIWCLMSRVKKVFLRCYWSVIPGFPVRKAIFACGNAKAVTSTQSGNVYRIKSTYYRGSQ